MISAASEKFMRDLKFVTEETMAQHTLVIVTVVGETTMQSGFSCTAVPYNRGMME